MTNSMHLGFQSAHPCAAENTMGYEACQSLPYLGCKTFHFWWGGHKTIADCDCHTPNPIAISAAGLDGLAQSAGPKPKPLPAPLEQTNWNRKEASRILNISYKALLYKTRQYGIEGPGRQSSRFVNSA